MLEKDIEKLFEKIKQDLIKSVFEKLPEEKNLDLAWCCLNNCELKIDPRAKSQLANMHLILGKQKATCTVFYTEAGEELMEIILTHELMHCVVNALYRRNMKHSKIFRDLGQKLTGKDRFVFAAKIKIEEY